MFLLHQIVSASSGRFPDSTGSQNRREQSGPNLRKVVKFITKGYCISNFWTWYALIRDFTSSSVLLRLGFLIRMSLLHRYTECRIDF